MGLSSVQYLKDIFPDSNITYGVSERAIPLFKHYKNINVEVRSMNFSAGNWLNEFKFLKRNKFDLIIELQQRGRTEKFFGIFKLLSSSKYYFSDWTRKEGGITPEPVIQKDLDCVWSAAKKFMGKDIPYQPSYKNYTPVFYTGKLKVKTNKFRVVVGISAGVSSRIWSLSNFRKLIEMLNGEYKDISFLIPVEKDDKFDEITSKINDWGFNNIEVISAGLSEIPYEISDCRYYIGNDTGIKHIAISLGMETLSIFGEAIPEIWHPYDTERHKYIYTGNIESIHVEEVYKESVNMLSKFKQD